jgi:DNA-binding transcriptional ArsR family regulator
MVEEFDARLDAVFHALADPTRRAMLVRLGERASSVGELARPFPISLAAASKHLQVLERAGLVRREVLGRSHRCHLEPAPLHAGAEWLRHYRQFWTARLDALEQALQAADAVTPGPGGQAAPDLAADDRPARSRRRPSATTRTP